MAVIDRVPRWLRSRRPSALLIFCAGLIGSASPAHAGKDCAVFTATLKSGDEVLQTFTTPTKKTIPAAQIPTGSVLELRGTFVEFNVDLDSFTLTDYTLTGVPAPNQITFVPTRVFDSKVPAATLTGSLTLELNASGQNLVLQRSGNPAMKIQAKDCDQGGLFQLENAKTRIQTNTLAQGFSYCFQASPTSKRFFIDGVVLGYDSPQAAALASGSGTQAVWRVQAGGRIGMVVGEDAVEQLDLAGPAAVAACPHQTP